MTAMHLLQAAAALVAAGTPWCVVRMASEVASRHARSVRAPYLVPRSVARLGWVTVWALPLVAAPAFWLQPPSLLMAGIDGVGFIGLSIVGLRALSEIQDASRPACEVIATTRTATLRPRRLGQYLAWPWRALPCAALLLGLALFGWRFVLPHANRRLLLPVAFAGFSVVFFWLYETWMRGEVSGGHSPDSAEDHAVELAMVLGCIGVAHALLDLDWSLNGAWGAGVALAGAALGIVGCALAVSSDLCRRRYTPVPLEPRNAPSSSRGT
jgi:hypothetical protein